MDSRNLAEGVTLDRTPHTHTLKKELTVIVRSIGGRKDEEIEKVKKEKLGLGERKVVDRLVDWREKVIF